MIPSLLPSVDTNVRSSTFARYCELPSSPVELVSVFGNSAVVGVMVFMVV